MFSRKVVKKTPGLKQNNIKPWMSSDTWRIIEERKKLHRKMIDPKEKKLEKESSEYTYKRQKRRNFEIGP